MAAAFEGMGDAAAALLLDRRVGKVLNGISPAVNIIQQVDGLTGDRVGELADKMLKSNPSAQRLRDIESRYAPSKAGQVAGEVARGVGGMLPSIAANIALPGSGMAVLGVQAGGQSAQQALNEGAALEQAVNYGVLSGAMEAATEMLSGGLGGLGEGLIDKGIGKLVAKNGTQKVGGLLSKVISNSLVKAVGDSLGEGLEEAVSAVVDPLLQRVTYNKEAESATLGEVLHDAFIGVLTGGVFQGVGAVANVLGGQKNTASEGETGEYRAEKPQNVELPTVPIINLSMQDVAKQNNGVLPQTGDVLRADAIARARGRLGLDKNSAVYIPASNVMRNGEEYVLKITKASLNKMFNPSDGTAVPVETVVIMDNLERIANNGVYFRSEGDRKGRDQIAGVDHLMTTVYIDGTPTLVDMRVRIVERGKSGGSDNVLYYLTPETITLTPQKENGAAPAAERHALRGEASPFPKKLYHRRRRKSTGSRRSRRGSGNGCSRRAAGRRRNGPPPHRAGHRRAFWAQER